LGEDETDIVIGRGANGLLRRNEIVHDDAVRIRSATDERPQFAVVTRQYPSAQCSVTGYRSGEAPDRVLDAAERPQRDGKPVQREDDAGCLDIRAADASGASAMDGMFAT
jgi:hypothetical protein